MGHDREMEVDLRPYAGACCDLREDAVERASLLEVLDVSLPLCSPSPDRQPEPRTNTRRTATLRGIKELLGDSPDLAQVVETFHRHYGSTFVDTYAGDTRDLLSPTVCRGIMSHYGEPIQRVRPQVTPTRDTLFGPLQGRGRMPSLDLARGMERAVLSL